MPVIENLTLSNLRKAYDRLAKDTRRFEKLIVRDPIDHLDFHLRRDDHLRSLLEDLRRGAYVPKAPLLHLAPKGKGISRPTCAFDVRDATTPIETLTTSLADQYWPKIEAQ